MDANAGVIAVEGDNIEEVLQDFGRLETELSKKLEIELNSQARFYESIFDSPVVVGRKRSPIKTVARLFRGKKRVRFGKILGRRVTNYGIRLVHRDPSPLDDQWLELKLEPTIQRPETTYSNNVVYGHRDKEKVVSMARSLLDLVSQLIQEME